MKFNPTLLPWLKGAGGALAALASVATVLSVLPELLQPQGVLQATYRHMAFEVPDALTQPDKRDSTIEQLNAALDKLYAYQASLAPGKWTPDSLRPSNLKSFGTFPRKAQTFALLHHGLLTLSLRNDGDKVLTNLRVVFPLEAYYQFTDAQQHTHAGTSTKKFALGDLDADETMEVRLWTLTEPENSRRLTIAYDGGVTVATAPEEVTGNLAWLIRHQFTLLYLTAALLVSLPLLGLLFLAIQQARSGTREEDPA